MLHKLHKKLKAKQCEHNEEHIKLMELLTWTKLLQSTIHGATCSFSAIGELIIQWAAYTNVTGKVKKLTNTWIQIVQSYTKY